MFMYVKIRVPNNKELHKFDSRKNAFDWVREQKLRAPCYVTVMTYDVRDELDNGERWYYDGYRFSRENVNN